MLTEIREQVAAARVAASAVKEPATKPTTAEGKPQSTIEKNRHSPVFLLPQGVNIQQHLLLFYKLI
jgi:hypothetical protein